MMHFELLNKHLRVPPNKQLLIKNKLSINQGQVIALWGANGIGKSTLLRKIYTEFSFTQFDLINPINNIREPRLGIMPQNVNEIIFPWLKVDKIVQIFESNFHSINGKISIPDVTNCSKKVKNLSGGEKQLLAFELMLNFNFDILFLDEPFAAMDFDNIHKYISKLRKHIKATGGIAFIVIHDLKILQNLSDSILVFSNKRNTIFSISNKYKGESSVNKELLNMLYE